MEERLTVGEIMELLDRCAAVVARGPLTGDRIGWLTYLLERVEREIDDPTETDRFLWPLLRTAVDDRLTRGRW